MLKKINCILMILCLVLNLTACGDSKQVSDSIDEGVVETKRTNKTVNKSSIKGDFCFYFKKSIDNSYNSDTYFTNCEDIPETKLCNGEANVIYLDEKRKNIIALVNSVILIKSLKKLDEEPIKVDDCSNTNSECFKVWNNKVLVYSNGSGIFTYDLDTKKKERVVENYYKSINLYGDTISFIESDSNNSSKISKFVTYNVKNKSKKEKDVSNLNVYSGTAYIVDNALFVSAIDKDEMVAKLYKITSDHDPIIIDEMKIAYMPYTRQGKEYQASLGYNIYDVFGNGTMYFGKKVAFNGLNSDGFVDFQYERYYYDGKNTKKLDYNSFNQINKKYNNQVYNVPIISAYIGKYGENGYKKGILIGDKFYENHEAKYISEDGKRVCMSYYEEPGNYNSYKSCVYNIDKNEKQDVDKTFREVWYCDEKILLYRANNNDLVLNNQVIDYNVERDEHEHNDDYTTFGYLTNAGIDIYKNGEVSTILSTGFSGGHLTNNSNAYYQQENDIYLYKDGESQLVASGVSGMYDSWLSNPGYFVIR